MTPKTMLKTASIYLAQPNYDSLAIRDLMLPGESGPALPNTSN
jgi:hypothetical protein